MYILFSVSVLHCRRDGKHGCNMKLSYLKGSVPFFVIILDHAFNFPEKGVNDVVKLSNMRGLTAFTVCLWMSSSNARGTPLSYAVSRQDNELVIDYNRYFRITIDNSNR